MNHSIEPKYAKTLSGVVYSYAVVTAGDFIQRLSQETRAPMWLIHFMDPESGELPNEAELNSATVYYLFVKPGGRFVDWFDMSRLVPTTLALNPNGVPLIEALLSNPKLFATLRYDQQIEFRSVSFWSNLSCNPAAIHILEQNLNRVDWEGINRNPAAIHLLEQNPDRIQWNIIAANTGALHIIKQNLGKIPSTILCTNTEVVQDQELMQRIPRHWHRLSRNPAATELLLANPQHIDWHSLSANTDPRAVELLAANPDKINWHNLSSNPTAIKLLEAYPDKISWHELSRNPAAMELLAANQDKISWDSLSANPSLFCPSDS